MSKISFALIFALCIFNFIIQGNAAIENATSEDPNASQKSDDEKDKNTKDVSSDQSSSNADTQTPHKSTDFPENESSQESINEDIALDEQRERRADLSDEKTAAFTVVLEYDEKTNSFKQTLPSIIKEIHGKWSLSSAYTDKAEEGHLCPDISVDENSAALKAAYEESPATKSCLFIKNFAPNEPKICTKEPMPWLTLKENIQPPSNKEVPLRINCNKKNQILLAFEYNNCGQEKSFLMYGEMLLNPDRPERKLPFSITATYQMYQICYDIKAYKTIWTRHHILEPMLFYDPTIPAKNIESIDLDTTDTSTFGLKPLNMLTKLKNTYKKDIKNEEMKAAYLVPMEHMAMQNWKKSTQHLINVALLHQKFQDLMRVIDNGLILASRHTFIHTGIHLQIFTTTETKFEKTDILFSRRKYTNWYKFIYNETIKAGALISLYNNEEDLAKQACGPNLRCNFNNWMESAPEIPEDVLKYTSCCGTTEKRIKELFQIDVEILQTIGLQQIIPKANKKDTELVFLRNNIILNSEQNTQDLQHSEAQPIGNNIQNDSEQDEFVPESDDLGRPSQLYYYLNQDEINDSNQAGIEEKESHDLENKGAKISENDSKNHINRENSIDEDKNDSLDQTGIEEKDTHNHHESQVEKPVKHKSKDLANGSGEEKSIF